jgi:Leucine-rich repeat (LRR) protein
MNINVIPQSPAVITSINCGTSTPKLSGSIDVSFFPNLINFSCVNNDIVSFTGYSGNSNLRNIYVNNNKLTDPIPSLSGLTNLSLFFCGPNQLTGSIPSLAGVTNLADFRCAQNQLTGFDGGSVPFSLAVFHAQENQLSSGAINAILAAFVAANRFSGALLLGGTGNAAPTGQGITDKATLISRSWTVSTN